MNPIPPKQNASEKSSEDFLSFEDIMTDIANESHHLVYPFTEPLMYQETNPLEVFKKYQKDYLNGLNNISLEKRKYCVSELEKKYPQILLYLLTQHRSIPFFSHLSPSERNSIVSRIKHRLGNTITISKEVPITKKEFIVQKTKSQTQKTLDQDFDYKKESFKRVVDEVKNFKYDGEFLTLGSKSPHPRLLRELGVDKQNFVKQKIEWEDGAFEKTWYYPTKIKNVYWMSYFANGVIPDIHENKLIFLENPPKNFLKREK